MEKQARQTRSRNTMKTTFCIPRFRTTSRKSTRLSPMSLLDRFRDAVFRLIMISALSKAAATGSTNGATYHESRSSSSSSNSPANCHRSYYYNNNNNYHPNDPHHSEAVADCIEFIKKSANDQYNRDSIDSTAEVVVPMPVM